VKNKWGIFMSLWMHLIPGYTVTKALTATVGLLSDSSSKPLSELEEIGRRVEIESAALLSQAKVEQEVSIARRILCAQEVEIEEFYDVKGSGSAGFSQQEQGVQLGLAGDVQRVTRRVIRFNGFNERFINDIEAK
jgi:hypothetical protein